MKRSNTKTQLIGLCLTSSMAASPSSAGQSEAVESYVYVPETVSAVWQEKLADYPDPALMPAMPAVDDLTGWRQMQQDIDSEALPLAGEMLKQYQAEVKTASYNGVPVLDIRPKGWQDNGKVLIYTHGGAYTFYSAEAALVSALPVADRTGLRVISVDYTLAPHAKWQQVTDQVLDVFAGLKQEGYALPDMAIYGDSAGGGLAAGSVLKMRDKGLGIPAAVVLWSPWSDITETGDTYTTLREAEPIYRYNILLKPSADAYAGPEDQKNPYVSPVYGDYRAGFPPTLIQGGTKEIFLSNFVRHYQALDSAGQTVKLDLYEGMPHVFQVDLPDAPEAVTALKKVDAFLREHLVY